MSGVKVISTKRQIANLKTTTNAVWNGRVEEFLSQRKETELLPITSERSMK